MGRGLTSHRLLQISDCHLGPLTSEALLGLNTDQSLQDVLALIQREDAQFDYMVCTGDIASAGHTSCYQRFMTILRQYHQKPIAWLPGNHDSVPLMAQAELNERPESDKVELGNWLILLLNSVVPGKVYGNFEPEELERLDAYLTANPSKHIMVMFHHQPVPVGSKWIDQYIIRNADALFAVIDRHPQVKALVWGHVHQDFRGMRGQLALIGTPATCVQFKPLCDNFTVDTLMPGYRWFDLHDDGTFDTGVARVTGKEYVIDYKSAGY